MSMTPYHPRHFIVFLGTYEVIIVSERDYLGCRVRMLPGIDRPGQPPTLNNPEASSPLNVPLDVHTHSFSSTSARLGRGLPDFRQLRRFSESSLNRRRANSALNFPSRPPPGLQGSFLACLQWKGMHRHSERFVFSPGPLQIRRVDCSQPLISATVRSIILSNSPNGLVKRYNRKRRISGQGSN